jgi:hypothetical protein
MSSEPEGTFSWNLQPGERLVFYEFCISLVLVSVRRPSRVYRLRPGAWGLLPGLPYTVVTLLLGWWGIPWGLIYTPLTLWTNLTGGRILAALPSMGTRPASQ